MVMRSLLAALPLAAISLHAGEEDFYRIVTLPTPPDTKLEVSGIAVLPDGRVAVTIRKGEVWLIENACAEPPAPRYRRFASGLHEPLGLAYHGGDFYLSQRTEVTRLRDTNGDGRADEYLTFAKGWGVSGNYHEYAYGPVFDRDGNAWVTLNATLGKRLVNETAWRGWSLKIHPDGTWEPVSGGFRSPCGFGFNTAGDLFCTDQQGNWFGSGPLLHVERGVFHGHADALMSCKLPGATFNITTKIPETLTVAEAAKQVPHYRPPAVWFPYRKMGMSCTDVLCDTTGGKFGPFTGQLFVGDFTMSLITRVFLEKVNGRYQGACFPFRKDFQCAVLRMAWGNDGSMFIGQSNRGWNSLGTRAYGLQRLIWTGKVPFEVKTMEARRDGFQLTFTQPINPASASATGFKLSSYTYKYHSNYGSDELDPRDLVIGSVKVAEDGLSAQLTVKDLRAGYVHELHLPDVRSARGEPLLHDVGYYTLNEIP